MPQFVIGVPQGALAASVGATIDVLSVASRSALMRGSHRITWRVVSTHKQVQLSGGMTITAEPIDLKVIPTCAVLVIPGIGLDHAKLDTGGDIRDRYQEGRVLRRMKMHDAHTFSTLASRHHSRGGKVAASCSGVLLLAMAGLLNERIATTHWRLAGFFRRHFPQVLLDTNRMVVDDHDVVSAGAAMAQMDLMLYLVRLQIGKDVADLAMKYLLIDSRTTQARYQVWDHLRLGEDDIAEKFETLIETSLSNIPTITEAARQLHVTTKTLSRRIFKATGTTPMALIHTIRMRHVERLLSLGELSLEEVAQRVGYANATSLRKLTMRMAQLPPTMLRHPLESALAVSSTQQSELKMGGDTRQSIRGPRAGIRYR